MTMIVSLDKRVETGEMSIVEKANLPYNTEALPANVSRKIKMFLYSIWYSLISDCGFGDHSPSSGILQRPVEHSRCHCSYMRPRCLLLYVSYTLFVFPSYTPLKVLQISHKKQATCELCKKVSVSCICYCLYYIIRD